MAPGNKAAHLECQKNRVKAFLIALGPRDDIRISAGTTAKEIPPFLEEKGHPASATDPLL
ncbi:MAG: hypothetical protein QHH06_09230 [Clostridiales bacterium]|nr:hypothetical protein [Eubacteriales bacterium]MDH7566647.1 hypothetical protein [Clostridiales bacterium]